MNTTVYLNPMQDKKAKKEPCVFLFDIFTNVRVSLQNVLTFIVTLFPHLCIISRSYLVPVPNQWTKSIPQKKCISWSNLSKIEGMITSLIELPELSNFGHMSMSIVKFDWPNKFFWWRHEHTPLWRYNFYLKISSF